MVPYFRAYARGADIPTVRARPRRLRYRQLSSAMIHTSVRNTPQGVAIDAALQESTGFRSAQDLYAQLRRDGSKIGLTTVYRHLQTLVETGTVDMVRTIDGEAV